ncbi:RNase P/MRP, p29 subunit [Stipitochalara longipes BDJ]|nr:RNase P/MRP, p29 subunit [Stipitochalara longipes BDJ]
MFAETQLFCTADKGTVAFALLSKAHSPDTAERIYNEKIRKRPLHLKPTEQDTAQQARRQARQLKLQKLKKKSKPAPLSARQKRAMMLYDIPKSEQKYEIYEPLHRMWIGYIQEILGLREEGGLVSNAEAAKLCSADFHGAELEVVRSRCVSRVGVKGIVVKDSKFVFEVVTIRNVVKVLPKEHTIFRFTVPFPGKTLDGDEKGTEEPNADGEEKKPKDLIFELHGDQFQYRAVDRANKKFKPHFLPDL